MSIMNLWSRVALTFVAATGLAACGGSDGPDPLAGATSYANAIAQANSAAGLNSTALQSSFATGYLDAGMTQAQLVDALGKDAAAFATPGYSGQPLVGLTDVAVSACTESNVCTITGTLTNADADTTAVPFSTQIVLENGSYRVLGDQKSS
ncbi:MAG: hypothetical protein NVS3B2_07560 [Ramlibacter sp.]